jgi:NADH-dependent peroxiredoxin subunit F
VLDESVRTQVVAAFDRIVHDVEIVCCLDRRPVSTTVAELVAELASCSPRVTQRTVEPDAGDRTPSFTITRVGDPSVAVSFAGLPLGHEFTSLVLAVVQVGGHRPPVADELLTAAANLAAGGEKLRFETYFSQACQNCPDVVQALNILAVHNPNVSHVAIDGSAFADEVAERAIGSVPTVLLNGEVFFHGRSDLAEIVARLDPAVRDNARRALDALDPFDMVVVGGGPAGAAAAVYAARKGIRTALVAERMGGQVQDTAGIENLVSVLHTEGPRLAADLAAHVAANDVTVVSSVRATALRPADTAGGMHSLVLDNGATLRARSLVLAPGAQWRTLSVPGEERLRNRGVTFCPHCDGPLFKNKPVAVVGGGNSGVEAAIDLAGVASHVTVVEYGDGLRADAVLLRVLESLGNVSVVTGAETVEISGDATVEALVYVERASGQVRRVDVDGVFVQIGLLPATGWLAGVVDLSSSGEIVVDARGATSVAGVFAAGDATTTPFKQIVVALGSGATAALAAFDFLVRHPAA